MKYILVDKKVVAENDVRKWGAWYERSEDRRVGETTIGEVRISTVFLGLEHGTHDGRPIVFETMIFGGTNNEYQERCTTWNEAVKMHKQAVALVAQDTKCPPVI